MDSTNIKYRYALESNGVIVDVKSLTPSDRKDYECVGCGNIVRPVLPETDRQNHFRHKVQVECSLETYLHRMGKLLFEKTYRECLERNEPYIIEYKVPVCCNYCEHGLCVIEKKIEQYDLTKLFRQIHIEKKDGNLIPDLILKTNSGDKIYIEIVVTHKSTISKINSNVRIIEFTLESEGDLAYLNNTKILFDDIFVEFINFNPIPDKRNLHSKCRKNVECFIVYPSGKCVLNSIKIYEFDRMVKADYLYIKKIDYYSKNIFTEEVEKAFYKKVAVKNCFLCRYHAIAKRFQRLENDGPIFCKVHKKTTTSNYAAECEIYRPDTKVFENNPS